MKYEDIKSPEELLEFMDVINYGFVDDDGKKYGAWDEEEFEKNVLSKWKLSSPERLLDVLHGHCFDQVELERDWFFKNGYKFKTYYIMFLFDEPNDYSTHTFLIYEDSGKWKLFEHADYYNRGIFTFESLEDALEFEMRHHIDENKKYVKVDDEVIKHLHVIEYNKLNYGISYTDFIDEVLSNGKDVTIKIN